MHLISSGEGLPQARDDDTVLDALNEAAADPKDLMGPDSIDALLSLVTSDTRDCSLDLFLVDYEQEQLIDIRTDETVPLEGSSAGRAFRLQAPVRDTDRLWVPVTDRALRLGVLRVEGADFAEDWVRVGGVVARTLVAEQRYTDRYQRLRRSQDMDVAAEVQWTLLPPAAFSCRDVSIVGHLEPCYEVGGDSFDYAYNDGTLDFAMFDAMGRGLEAAMLSVLAVGVYRRCRRCGHSLAQIGQAVDDAIARYVSDSQFVTAIFGRLDASTGRVELLGAGHPRPLLFTDERPLGDEVVLEPCPPLGVGWTTPRPTIAELKPQDRLVVYTDGIVDSRAGTEFFGVERLKSLIAERATDGDLTQEDVRRVTKAVAEFSGQLNDDATLMIVSRPQPDIGA